MPDPRQQNHKLSEGALMFGKDICRGIECRKFYRNSVVNVIFPSKVFINQHTKIFNIIFGL